MYNIRNNRAGIIMKKLLAYSMNAAILATLVAVTAPAASITDESSIAPSIDKILIEVNYQTRKDQDYFLYSPEKFKEEFCMAQNIYFEAGIDNHAGMTGVADVTLNRVNDARYPNSVCEVVYDGQKDSAGNMRRNRCQFSWYCDGKSDRVPEGSENWVRAQMVAWEMMREGRFRGITEGATHYHATYVSPRWRSDRGMDLIGRIGSHIFYRWN